MLPDDIPRFDPAARAAAKARSRERDQQLLDSGQVSPAEMQRINGGGGFFRQKGRILGYGVCRQVD